MLPIAMITYFPITAFKLTQCNKTNDNHAVFRILLGEIQLQWSVLVASLISLYVYSCDFCIMIFVVCVNCAKLYLF